MRKFLLCFAIALIFSCVPSEPAKDDDWQKKLANYEGKCADIAFVDTNAKLNEAKELKQAGKSQDANKAMLEAKRFFDVNVAKYNDMKGSVDKAEAKMKDQKSRLSDLESNVKQSDKKKFANAKAHITAKHKEVSRKIEECDGEGAAAILEEIEKELRALEGLAVTHKNPDSGSYTVKKGDCLWRIAVRQYANPYFWPLIFWANKSSIKDPDLIYPNQKFKIDSNASDSQKKDASTHAKTRGPWSLYDGK
ncbi:MAG: LysM peptidoglycan-binding domain-containing protein [Deferribacteraceae bacterium]|jgi:nucleoid-associated protein YgaU|nr:LysM peptidoglycan-binding domain-containing protein [Deferribacteraceae bacterium]